jgi:hypothetical protein
MTSMGDIVLVYQEESPVFFARIEDICADRKPNWYQVKLLVLQVPLVETVWILREAYIHGETFTMDGKAIRLEQVKGASQPKECLCCRDKGCNQDKDKDSQAKAARNTGNVISLADRKIVDRKKG